MGSDWSPERPPTTTTFFTACTRSYEAFILPYAVSVMHHNDDAAVEVCVENPERFATENDRAMAILAGAYTDRFLVRGGTFQGVRPGSVRFLEQPLLRSEHTYIGDVDVLVLEGGIAATHLANMAKTGLPYSNILRLGHRERMSGLHFTRTDAHYPLVIPDAPHRFSDEMLLYQLVVAKGLPLPNPAQVAHRFRPVHGWHLTLNRPPTNRDVGRVKISWGVHPQYLNAYLALIASPIWEEIAPLFSPAFRLLVAILDGVLQSQHPDREIYHPEATKALFCHLTGTDHQ